MVHFLVMVIFGLQGSPQSKHCQMDHFLCDAVIMLLFSSVTVRLIGSMLTMVALAERA